MPGGSTESGDESKSEFLPVMCPPALEVDTGEKNDIGVSYIPDDSKSTSNASSLRSLKRSQTQDEKSSAAILSVPTGDKQPTQITASSSTNGANHNSTRSFFSPMTVVSQPHDTQHEPAPQTSTTLAPVRLAVCVFAIGLCYFLCGKASLSVAFSLNGVSPIWIPSGVSVAMLYLTKDLRLLIGIFLGAFFVNINVQLDGDTNPSYVLPLACLVGTTNALEAFCAVWFMRRFSTESARNHPFCSTKDVSLFFISTFVACGVNGFMGPAWLYFFGVLDGEFYFTAAYTWGVGDFTGVLVFSPFLLVALNRASLKALLIVVGRSVDHQSPSGYTPERTSAKPEDFDVTSRVNTLTQFLSWGALSEFVFFLIVTSAFTSIIFADVLDQHVSVGVFSLLFACVQYSALRFSTLGSATTLLFMACIGTVFTANLQGPFFAVRECESCEVSDDEVNRALVYASLLYSVMASLLLFHSGNIATMQRMERCLEMRVDERTAELEELNRSLLLAQRQAKLAAEHKTHFLSSMSHEIRTPLSGVIGMCQILREDQSLAPQTLEEIGIIHISAMHLNTIINDILDFSKLDNGSFTLNNIKFSLRECMEQALVLSYQRSVYRSIGVWYDIGSTVPRRVVGDVTRIRQIIINLISNALKFTSKGHVGLSAVLVSDSAGSPLIVDERAIDRAVTAQVPIGVTVAPKGGIGSEKNGFVIHREKTVVGGLQVSSYFHLLQMSVHDTGNGMTKQESNRLFRAFTQLKDTHNKEHRGTGLGLVICARLVSLMRGAMWVSSKKQRGSTFSFVIPIPVEEPDSVDQPVSNGTSPVHGVGKRQSSPHSTIMFDPTTRPPRVCRLLILSPHFPLSQSLSRAVLSMFSDSNKRLPVEMVVRYTCSAEQAESWSRIPHCQMEFWNPHLSPNTWRHYDPAMPGVAPTTPSAACSCGHIHRRECAGNVGFDIVLCDSSSLMMMGDTSEDMSPVWYKLTRKSLTDTMEVNEDLHPTRILYCGDAVSEEQQLPSQLLVWQTSIGEGVSGNHSDENSLSSTGEEALKNRLTQLEMSFFQSYAEFIERIPKPVLHTKVISVIRSIIRAQHRVGSTSQGSSTLRLRIPDRGSSADSDTTHSARGSTDNDSVENQVLESTSPVNGGPSQENTDPDLVRKEENAAKSRSNANHSASKFRPKEPKLLVRYGDEADEAESKLPPLKILIAEDNFVNQKVAIRMLKRLGYDADTASNGFIAADMVKQGDYDIVFMDMQMPKCDGVESAMKIQSEVSTEKLPVIIALTASVMQSDRDLCLQYMDDFMAKPLVHEQLTAMLRKWGEVTLERKGRTPPYT